MPEEVVEVDGAEAAVEEVAGGIWKTVRDYMMAKLLVVNYLLLRLLFSLFVF
jgi:hypothetical protein